MTDTAAGSDALAVEYRTVGSLKPDPRNARTHPKRQLEQITASIKEFGFVNPILIDEQGTIIAGHGRLRAANEAGPFADLFHRPSQRRLGFQELTSN